MCVLEVNANRSDILRLEGWLLADQLLLVPGFAFCDGFHFQTPWLLIGV